MEKRRPSCHCLGAWAGHTEHRHTGQRTRETTERHHTRDNGHARQQGARCDMMQVVIFIGRHQRGPAPYTKRNAMQRSKFDIGRADAGAGGTSMISGSGGASGMGASSSSSGASAMAQSTGSSGPGSGSMCLQKSSSRAWSAAPSVTASLKSLSLWARKRRQPVVQTWFIRLKAVAMLCS